MSQNATVLPRRMAQPILRSHDAQAGVGRGTTEEVAALRAKVATLERYVISQREMMDRMWDRLTRSISEHHMAGPLANRPPFGVFNRTYLVTDTAPNRLSVDIGTAWKDLALP